jgi:hypothetical protein
MPMPSPRLLSLQCNLGGSIFSQSLNLPNPMLTQSCPYVLKYSISNWVDWVAQYYMNFYPMSKCYAYYLRVTVVTFTQ